jgi:hypothetical protein
MEVAHKPNDTGPHPVNKRRCGAGFIMFCGRLLRRHVIGRAERLAGHGQVRVVVELFREAEIGDAG